MRYTYAYKTSDGVRHEASMDAGSREAVFETLRAQGIKAIKVVAADGSKANGAATNDGGQSRRHLVIVALFLLLAVALSGGAAWVVASIAGRRAMPAADAAQSFLTARTRRQVIGDAAIIEKGVATGWADVFRHEGERFLASFAIPGVKAGQRNTTVEEIEAALSRSVEPPPGIGIEAQQIISMVEGMKAEARAYIKAGGSAVGYGRRLTERQDAEIAIYERTKSELEQAKDKLGRDAYLTLWEEKNDQLRNLGIKLVPLED